MDADASAESVAEVVMALPERPSTVIVMAPTASEGPKPAPDTFTRVPLGPDVVPSEAVAAPAAMALILSAKSSLAASILRLVPGATILLTFTYSGGTL